MPVDDAVFQVRDNALVVGTHGRGIWVLDDAGPLQGLTAEATRESEILRGEGDAEKTRILGSAYSQDPDFFAFYRSMQAYEAGLKHNDTRMVLKPDSDFFRYFADPSGKAREEQRK